MAAPKRSSFWANFWNFVLRPFSGIFKNTFRNVDFSATTSSPIQTKEKPSSTSSTSKVVTKVVEPTGWESLYDKSRGQSGSDSDKDERARSQTYNVSPSESFFTALKNFKFNFKFFRSQSRKVEPQKQQPQKSAVSSDTKEANPGTGYVSLSDLPAPK